MAHENITINGVPFREVVETEKRGEIHRHLRNEQAKLGSQCGLRRSFSTPSRGTGRRGRSRRVIDVLLMNELEPFLRDEGLPLSGIAELFNRPIGTIRVYQARLGLTRRRGRKGRR